MKSENDIKNRIENFKIFQGIMPSTIDEIIKNSVIKEVYKGDVILRDKDEVDSLFIAIDGIYSLYKLNNNGDKKTIFVLGQSDIINLPMSYRMSSSINCEVFAKGNLMIIKQDKLFEIMKNDSVLSFNIIDYYSLRIRRLYRQLKNTTGSIGVDKRIAAKFWKLSKDFGVLEDGLIKINLDISVTYLAELLGVRRETVSRQLKVLMDKNLIIQKNSRFYINSREDLESYFKNREN